MTTAGRRSTGSLADVIRRPSLRVAVATAAAAAALAGCATFDNTDVVAEVDGATVDESRLDDLLTEFTERSELFQTTPIVNGRATGADTRIMVAALVRQQLFRNFVDEYDLDVDELRQSFIDTTLADSPVADTSTGIRTLIADIEPQVQAQAVGDLAVPDIDELEDLYEDDPASTGVLCMRHILVETRAQADRVVDELEAGADFATLAAERSTDPSAADSGGALNDGTSECIPLTTVLQGFDPAFTAGALAARPGAPSAPVESSFGWHVILHRPWDEVAAGVGARHQPGQSGGLLFEGYRATADVEVDPRYGVWDPIAGGVQPLG